MQNNLDYLMLLDKYCIKNNIFISKSLNYSAGYNYYFNNNLPKELDPHPLIEIKNRINDNIININLQYKWIETYFNLCIKTKTNIPDFSLELIQVCREKEILHLSKCEKIINHYYTEKKNDYETENN